MENSLLDSLAADGRLYTDVIRAALEATGGPKFHAIRRAAARLRSRAGQADVEPLVACAAALERMARQAAAGESEWSVDLAALVRDVVEAICGTLAALPLDRPAAESRLNRLAAELEDRLGEPSVDAEAVLATTSSDEAHGEAAHGGEAGELLAELSTDLEGAVEHLRSDPRDREPLKNTLRRIRRLRELGRVAEGTPADRALSAVEEVILQIADLNATVGPAHLTVFSRAREVVDAMWADAEQDTSTSQARGRAFEVDRLKDELLQRSRRARQVVWVSDLFYGGGPHVVASPAAERAGGPEPYFLAEARRRVEQGEALRSAMLEEDVERMRLAGEELAQNLRHLRERAVALDHPEFGRLARRTAAALRAQLMRPPTQVRAVAGELGEVLAALSSYLEAGQPAERQKAVGDAEEALNRAVSVKRLESQAQIREQEGDPVFERALLLRTRLEERLRAMGGPEVSALRRDLEELFELLSHFASVPSA